MNAIKKSDRFIGWMDGSDSARECVVKRAKQAAEEKDYKTFDALMTVLNSIREVKNPYL